MKFVIMSLFCVLTSLLVQAQTAAALFEQDLLKQVYQFKNKIQMYHYFYAPVVDTNNPQQPKKLHPQLDQKNTRDEWVNYYMSLRSGAFWDTTNRNIQFTNAGPGVYFAIDPNSSKEFGETYVVLNAPAGQNYLNVFEPIALRAVTLKALVNESIISSTQLSTANNGLGLRSGFGGYSLQFMVLPGNEKFRQLVSDFMLKNKISFIQYIYKSHLAGFCKKADQSAFVFIGAHPSTAKPTDYLRDLTKGGALTLEYQNAMLFSAYPVLEQTNEELQQFDLQSRFRNVLSQIRTFGVNAAKKLVYENLTEPEINALVGQSYMCERRQ